MFGNVLNRKYLSIAVSFSFILFSACGTKGNSGFSAQDTGGFPISQSGGGDINAIPNLTPSDRQAITEVSNGLETVAPQSGSFEMPPEVQTLVTQIQVAEKKGEDTTALRVTLAGKMLSACGTEVAKYAPSPGEPMTGTWLNKCDDVAIGSTGVVTAKYPSQTSTGIPLGVPKFSFSGYGTANGISSIAVGQVSVEPSGAMTIHSTWQELSGPKRTSQWITDGTDQPSAATGKSREVAGGTDNICVTATSTLVTSKNPIPEKYSEAMKKMGECYRKSMVLMSRAMGEYFSEMGPAGSQALQQLLYLK